MKPILTIIVPIYNHEKYVLKSLDSIKKQTISYPFEVLIGEDASTDSSRKLLEEFQKTAPSNYFFVYRDKNKGMLDNIFDLFYRAQGKYVILLEGDDYWTYHNKINEQIAFLEVNSRFSGYAHSVVVVDESGSPLDIGYKAEKGNGIYRIEDYLRGKLPGQTASFMYRNYFSDSEVFQYWDRKVYYALDRFIAFVVATKGDVYCTSQKWSAYRYVTQCGDNFSSNIDSSSEEFALNALEFHRMLYRYSLKEKCSKRCVKVSEKLFFKSYYRDEVINKRKNKFKTLRFVMSNAKFPISTNIWIFWKLLSKRFDRKNLK